MSRNPNISDEYLEKAGERSVNFSDRKGFIVGGEYYTKGDQINVNGTSYKVDSLLGIGGMAAVWKVFNSDDTAFSLKVYTGGISESRIDHLELAFEASSFLCGDGFQKIIDVDLQRNIMVCEFVDAVELSRELIGAFQIERFLIARILTMKSILEFFHTLKKGEILHRDIKISNTFVDFSDAVLSPRVVFADPDLAIRSLRWVETGNVLGTSTYVSPEVARGELDLERDIYAAFTAGARIFKGITEEGKSNVRQLSGQLKMYFDKGRVLRPSGFIKKRSPQDRRFMVKRASCVNHPQVFNIAIQSGIEYERNKMQFEGADIPDSDKQVILDISDSTIRAHHPFFWALTRGLYAPSGSRSVGQEEHLSDYEQQVCDDLATLKQFRTIKKKAGF